MLSKAKVPLVKFVHAATGIQVDVCFDQASGLKSGAAAKEMMRQMQPVCSRFDSIRLCLCRFIPYDIVLHRVASYSILLNPSLSDPLRANTLIH